MVRSASKCARPSGARRSSSCSRPHHRERPFDGTAVKPNDTWASEDDTSGITQPDTLRAVLRAVKRHGPRELVVTGGAGAAETVRHLWEAARLGIGESDVRKMRFPALSLRDALGRFARSAA